MSGRAGWIALALLAASCREGNAESDAEAASSVPKSASAASGSGAGDQPAPRPPPPDRWGDKTMWQGTLAEENAHMLDLVVYHHGISSAQRDTIAAIFKASGIAGQGNPVLAVHGASVKACHDKLAAEHVGYEDAGFERICGGKYMAPLYDPKKEKAEDAHACIDQFEFPNIPCQYPATWIRANEAVEICRALGKRLCDAHEWEGACEGRLAPISEEYNFTYGNVMHADDAVKLMRDWHFSRHYKDQHWAYGDEYQEGICATGTQKSKSCGGGFDECGTNTYPAGMFPRCKSKLGVYDQHGNAAEHMNLPILASQMSTAPEQTYGETEMKGSWFVFDTIRAHDDWCRWRAPFWHGTTVMSPGSHRNYHLGFRCCKSVP